MASPVDLPCLPKGSRSVGCAVCKTDRTHRVQRDATGRGAQTSRLPQIRLVISTRARSKSSSSNAGLPM